MKYFAYGSNMSLARLTARVPSAVALGCYSLLAHDLRFHKTSTDGSGKCDAFYTGNSRDVIFGALFEMDPNDRLALDRAEGLGFGYDTKNVTVLSMEGLSCNAYTYVATHIEHHLKPYSWYRNHVLVGAAETGLPQNYIRAKIASVEYSEDEDHERDLEQRLIHGEQ